jgi:hypothetical protein
MANNPELEVFRLKARFLLEQHAQRMRIFVVENKAIGLTPEAIRALRLDPKSKWAQEREALIKAMKREVAGLINRVHLAAYTGRIV